jgi:hypothetical protein
MIETENARIASTFIGREDHGIPTFWLQLEFESTGQGFGGVQFTSADQIIAILDTLQVNSWESLPGHTCRARHDSGKVYAIGHFMKDRWCTPTAGKIGEGAED